MRERYISKRTLKDSSYEDEASGYRSGSKVKKMRKGSRSVRGRTTDDWEWNDDSDLPEGYMYGRVIEAQKKHIFVAEEDENGITDTGLLWLCTVAKRHFQRVHKERNFVVVGDRILFHKNEEQDTAQEKYKDLPRGTIQHRIPRKNEFSRKDPLNKDWEHIMLTNVDLLVITASVLRPEVRWGLLDRMLVQAELANIPAIIVLNKVDLLNNSEEASPGFIEEYKKRVQIYRNIGYQIFELSALYKAPYLKIISQLKKLFKGKLIGFSGHSGVGKSSLINLFEPEFEQIVDENPDIFYKGRHTTTYNSLLHLEIGAYAIDTPGVRSFNIPEQDSITLTHCFKEFRSFKCKYRECTHVNEPDCGIKAALKEGLISQERYRSYVGILTGVGLRDSEVEQEEAEMIADLKARSTNTKAL